ncbi:MAG: hypothetical protein ACPHUF_13065 [Gammaproteobacteria bacterium]
MIVFAPATFGHGGVSMEDDLCVMQIGPYRAHFTGYQPQLRASQEFCEDIPHVAEAIIVLDFLDNRLREMDIEFRVIRDVNDIGISATYDDLGGRDAITAASVFVEAAKRYPRGSVNVSIPFDAPGNFIGIVEANDGEGNQHYRSVFPFAVAATPWYSGWQWLLALVVLGLVLYVRPWTKIRQATAPDPEP